MYLLGLFVSKDTSSNTYKEGCWKRWEFVWWRSGKKLTTVEELFTSFSLFVEGKHRLAHAAWASQNVESAGLHSRRRIIVIIHIASFQTFQLVVKQVFRTSTSSINKRLAETLVGVISELGHKSHARFAAFHGGIFAEGRLNPHSVGKAGKTGAEWGAFGFALGLCVEKVLSAVAASVDVLDAFSLSEKTQLITLILESTILCCQDVF